MKVGSWKGIFVCSVLQNILMQLIRNKTYETVDSSMNESQIEDKKKNSVQNNLFILNAMISDVMGSVRKESIDSSEDNQNFQSAPSHSRRPVKRRRYCLVLVWHSSADTFLHKTLLLSSSGNSSKVFMCL